MKDSLLGFVSSYIMFSVLCVQVLFLLNGVCGMQEQFAIAGRRAALPCNVTDSSFEDDVTLVLWYKGELKSPIYTLDARKSPLGEARHFPGSEMGSRARFDLNSVPPVLYLEPLHAEDDGIYKCRTEFKRSRTVTEHVRLHVIVPPLEVVIVNEKGHRLRDVIGPYNEGTRVVIICEAEGIPSPSVTWWKDSILVDDSYFQTMEGYVRNEMVFPDIQRDQLLVSYTCNASNTNLTRPAIATITIDMNLKALGVRITTPQRPLAAGGKFQLECESWGARPKALLSWWINRRKIQSGKETVSKNLTTSSLSFSPTPEDNGKSLSCRAENPTVSEDILEDTWVLDIEFIPEIMLALGANIHPSAIREGNDVFLECHIKANPPVSGVRWYFDGNPLLSDVSKGLIVSNRSLVLQKVKRENRGRYRCAASNKVGDGYSEDFFLSIKHAPVCLRPRNAVYGISNYETVNVSCEVEADPAEVKFHWSLNNTLECIDILSNIIVNGTSSTIMYTPGVMFGYGVLLCWGTNAIGTQRDPCAAKIIPAGAPESVIGCRISNQTSTSLRVECIPGFDGGLQQRYHLEVYTSSMEKLQANLSSSESPIFKVDHLRPSTSYVLVMYSSNSKGRSRTVVLMAKTYAPPEKRTKDTGKSTGSSSSQMSSLSPVLFILMGVIAVLVIIASIIVIIMRKLGRRPEKSSSCEETESKYDIPLKKDMLAISDPAIESPDVIPNSSDPQTYIEEKDGSHSDTDANYGFTKSPDQSSDFITSMEQ